MTEEEFRIRIATKIGLSLDALKPIQVTNSRAIGGLQDKDSYRYGNQNQCFNNCAHLVLDDKLPQAMEYVVAVAVRQNGSKAISELERFPELARFIWPLSDSVYAFTHAIVRDTESGKYHDPTLQRSDRGFAEHYFMVEAYTLPDLAEYLQSSDFEAPQVLFD